jgi:uncharacterized protein (DUF488 family)
MKLSKIKKNGTKPLFTLGYEGRDAEEVLERLVTEGIELLIDVRYRPQSRKKGLSKNALIKECTKRGISYIHERDLGTPPEILKEHRETGFYDWDAYLEFLKSKENTLDTVSAMAAASKACLLCYEADAGECHRRFVAEEFTNRTGAEVIHLR